VNPPVVVRHLLAGAVPPEASGHRPEVVHKSENKGVYHFENFPKSVKLRLSIAPKELISFFATSKRVRCILATLKVSLRISHI